jgi:FAD/FMN-containing dehydrogenase
VPRVNDLHSALNETQVRRIAEPRSVEEVAQAVHEARREGIAVSICGGRHAMGGQQFGTDTLLVDLRRLDRVLGLDRERGLLEVEAGILWPALIAGSLLLQEEQGEPRWPRWGIAQKQTGADRLSVGGTLSANGHGRGLTLPPFVSDVESFVLVDADGEVRRCSRSENAELFALAAGGYGLFGVIASVVLRLAPRRKLERVVELQRRDGLMAAFEERIHDGYLYGDFQFAIDERSGDFLDRGVFSCYRPVDPATPIPEGQLELSDESWRDLLFCAHADRARAWDLYTSHYLATSGQIYPSDTHQLSPYFDGYHAEVDRKMGRSVPATEIITEIYVPRPRLADFLAAAAEDLRRRNVPVIYGTVRLIEKDEDSFLAWAREPWACVVLNLCTSHAPAGIARSAGAFRALIDLAAERGGSYFLTYHRFATREQAEACHPRLRAFLDAKRERDPEERFQSDWYRHHVALLEGGA